MIVQSQQNHAGRPASRPVQSADALLAVLGGAHQKVESCISELELITSETESDEMTIGSARMRIGQANLARRRIVQEVCGHLADCVSPHEAGSLRSLQTDDITQFQLVSRHIQHWTASRVKEDWRGYCAAFRALAARVRETMLAEKQLLYPLLQHAAR